MSRFSTCLIILLCSLLPRVQAAATNPSVAKDSVQKAHTDTGYVCNHHHYSIKPTTDFDQRFSFIRNNAVNIWGQRAGILLNEKIKFGFGIYYMDDTKINRRNTATVANSAHYVKQSLLFGTTYVEPFLLRRKYWELSVPFEVGFGKASSKVFETSSDLFLRSTSKDFIPAGAGLSLSFKLPALPHFKPLSWIGINFLAGYRYCLLQNVYKTDYDGAFWSVSGAIFLDRVFDDCRTWKRNRRMRNL
jgi:hypothetical protein